MAARRSDLRRPLGRGLALDVRKVPGIGRLLGDEHCGRLGLHAPVALQEGHQLFQIIYGEYPDPLHASGLDGVLPGHEEHVLPHLPGGDDHGQNPVHPPHVPVEGQLSQIHGPGKGRLLQHPLR